MKVAGVKSSIWKEVKDFLWGNPEGLGHHLRLLTGSKAFSFKEAVKATVFIYEKWGEKSPFSKRHGSQRQELTGSKAFFQSSCGSSSCRIQNLKVESCDCSMLRKIKSFFIVNFECYGQQFQ